MSKMWMSDSEIDQEIGGDPGDMAPTRATMVSRAHAALDGTPAPATGKSRVLPILLVGAALVGAVYLMRRKS